MNLVYICKNSWWDARKARKVLLPYAFSEFNSTNVLLVNAAILAWQRRKYGELWVHPVTGMKVLTPIRVFPLQRFSLIQKLNQFIRWKSILKQVLEFPQTGRSDTFFILSDPEDVYIADFIRKEGYQCFFDWTENWDSYAQAVGSMSQTKISPRLILSRVDGVIVVSKELEKLARDMGLNCLHLQNAVSEQFSQSLDACKSKIDCMAGVPKPRVVHVGSYNPSWILWDWLIHVAKQNPSVSFCMLGGGGEQDLPENIPKNIFLLGRVKYEDIPAYLCSSQVCMLLYKQETTSAGDPTKLYEYLAAGLPIISTPHPRCLDFKEYVYVAEDKKAFNHQLHIALREGEDEREKRVSESRNHTWRVRANKLKQWLES